MKSSDAYASALTSMRCGGRIAQFLTVESEEDILRLTSVVENFIIIGGGTNMIFADGLTLTPVIKLGEAFEKISVDGNILKAGGAATIYSILAVCKEKGLSGLEFMAGIPGTVGGAVWMNAGTTERGIMDAVSYIDVMDAKGKRRIDNKAISYGYRHTDIPANTVITMASLELVTSSTKEVSGKIKSYIDKRGNQPGGASSGCIFRNPDGQSAGYLIDRAGLKGHRVGGAVISTRHANFIINDSNANSSDVLTLIKHIKNEIRRQFDVELKEEVRIIV